MAAMQIMHWTIAPGHGTKASGNEAQRSYTMVNATLESIKESIASDITDDVEYEIWGAENVATDIDDAVNALHAALQKAVDDFSDVLVNLRPEADTAVSVAVAWDVVREIAEVEAADAGMDYDLNPEDALAYLLDEDYAI
jgi:hypothetical protein